MSVGGAVSTVCAHVGDRIVCDDSYCGIVCACSQLLVGVVEGGRVVGGGGDTRNHAHTYKTLYFKLEVKL